MTIASEPTLLSLGRYAKIIGLNPVHFSQAEGNNFWPDFGNCEDVWFQHSWQHKDDYAGREDLAFAISEAEEEIASILGFYPAPKWIHGEVHSWDASLGGIALIKTDYGYVISGGERAVSSIESGAAVVYSDADGDGWKELATITVPTTVTNRQQIKLYFAGNDGKPEWEIRPLRSVALSGGNAIITVDSWLLFEPSLWDSIPASSSTSVIDPENDDNYVDEVDVYREYTDITAEHATIYWGPSSSFSAVLCPSCGGAGCPACSSTEQGGCFRVKNSVYGIIEPWLATYDADNNMWVQSAQTCGGAPNQVKINYQAGRIDQDYLRGNSLDPLDSHMANAIAFMATARIGRDLCACDSTRKFIEELRRDLSMSSRNEFYARYESQDIFHNPFGTRVGEVRAWNIVRELTPQGQFDGGGF